MMKAHGFVRNTAHGRADGIAGRGAPSLAPDQRVRCGSLFPRSWAPVRALPCVAGLSAARFAGSTRPLPRRPPPFRTRQRSARASHHLPPVLAGKLPLLGRRQQAPGDLEELRLLLLQGWRTRSSALRVAIQPARFSLCTDKSSKNLSTSWCSCSAWRDASRPRPRSAAVRTGDVPRTPRAHQLNLHCRRSADAHHIVARCRKLGQRTRRRSWLSRTASKIMWQLPDHVVGRGIVLDQRRPAAAHARARGNLYRRLRRRPRAVP